MSDNIKFNLIFLNISDPINNNRTIG